MTATVLVTRGARVDQIQRVLRGMQADVRVLAWGDDLRCGIRGRDPRADPGRGRHRPVLVR